MRPIVHDGHVLTADDLDSLRDEVIRWRDASFDQWPEAIPFTTTSTHLIAVMAQVIEQVREDERVSASASPHHSDPGGASAVGKVVPSRPIQCEAQTRRGTGLGTCATVLDEHGVCSRAIYHVD